MNAQQIRNKYIEFYKQRDHKIIPRALLVPQNDPTTLFTGSGMQPMVPYLLGEEHPEGKRIADSQTCLRVQDIEEVGDPRHTTFFEMLGNWSLGDYFKKEQLPWIFEFMVDVVGLDPNKIYVTAFIGDKEFNVPKDTESGEIWKSLFKSKGIEAGEVDSGSEANAAKVGMPAGARIFYYDDKKNWWWRGSMIKNMTVGEPGGPSTELFYEFDFIEHDTSYGEKCHPNCDCGRFVEIGNNVLMEYVRTEKGIEPLPSKNIDFGGGLERIAQAAINSPDMFKVSLLWPIVEKLEEISGKKYENHTNAMRVIADHLRGAAFLAVDGVTPSNKEQGYVMRRLMRRAIRFAFELGVEQNFMQQIVPVIAEIYEKDFPEVAKNRDHVVEVLAREEKVFRQTLRNGLKVFEKLTTKEVVPSSAHIGLDARVDGDTQIGKVKIRLLRGEDIFLLYDTYGFPVELSVEEAFKQEVEVPENWREDFEKHMQEQRARSQTASKGVFKGGLGGQQLIHKKYHTATHLLYQALRDVLGKHVIQRGSNITEERLRFDFSHPEKVTPEQLKQAEDIVNEQIGKDLKISWAEYPTTEATGPLGALGQFGDRYGETVKVYKMIADGAEKPFSFEICGGPHVDHTLQLFEDGKRFKILKEEASSAGVRRIKAVLQ
ncbi:MAG TPA: alanine--tRNA ligase [Candidatus Saccharimonadales bacterium]|nr:alanine--tRNA ligase [Candidatus Saccharimonadales bacterium]